MKTLNLYIARQLIIGTLLGTGVLTFVFLAGSLVRIFDLVARGLPPWVVLKFVAYLVPAAMGFTVPLALLCTTILVFSHLSANNEITAMRALGVSLWEVITPALLFGFTVSVLCLYLLAAVKPWCLYRAYLLRKQEGSKNPEVFFTAGVVEVPGYVIYIGRRNGRELRDLEVYALGPNGTVTQDISAREGTLAVDPKREILTLAMRQAVISVVEHDARGAVHLRRVAGDQCAISVNYGTAFNSKAVTRPSKYMNMSALFARIRIYAARGLPVTPLYVELHMRLSMGLSPLAFLLLGIPLGIRTRRSENAVGLTLSLAFAVIYYAFIVLAQTFRMHPEWRPEWLVWIPNIAYQIGGIAGIHRLAAR